MCQTLNMKTIISIICVLAVHQIQCADDIQSRVIGDEVPASDRDIYELAVITPDNKICTAALIDPFWAITSANCASRSTRLRVKYGREPGTYNAAEYIRDIYIHPAFNKATLANDIALIQLATAAPISTRLLDIPNMTEIFSTAHVSGYGKDSETTDIKLRQVSVLILNNAQCQKYTPMNAYKLCTFWPNACEGDQGGPLVANNKLVGIISVDEMQTLACGMVTFQPLITYTRVAPYKPWIKSVTRLNYL